MRRNIISSVWPQQCVQSCLAWAPVAPGPPVCPTAPLAYIYVWAPDSWVLALAAPPQGPATRGPGCAVTGGANTGPCRLLRHNKELESWPPAPAGGASSPYCRAPMPPCLLGHNLKGTVTQKKSFFLFLFMI